MCAYIECPAAVEHIPQPSVLLAGGITGCPDWQHSARQAVANLCPKATVLNPRRESFDVATTDSKEQINWEYHAMQSSSCILFWFPQESVCPIALYELGYHAARNTPLAVGTHPSYPRRLDVLEQLRLARPNVQVLSSLDQVVKAAAQLLLACHSGP